MKEGTKTERNRVMKTITKKVLDTDLRKKTPRKNRSRKKGKQIEE